MPSSIEIERKIVSFRTVDNIVNSMKAFAGMTVRKTEGLVLNVRDYESTLLQGLADVSAHQGKLPAAFGRAQGGEIIVAFGSSQGLCSPFNENVASKAAELAGAGGTLIAIGRRLRTALGALGVEPGIYEEAVVSVGGIGKALLGVLSRVSELYVKEGLYYITLVFSYVSEKRAFVAVDQILPLEPGRLAAYSPLPYPPRSYMPLEKVLEALLEEFLYISLYRAYAESLRAENWHRLRRLESATESIEKHLAELKSLQNYARQEEITEELHDITPE